MGDLAAVVFDFDGTLVDTEWPIFERARAAVATFGAELTDEVWATHAVGVSMGEPYWDTIAGLLGIDVDEAGFDAAYQAVTHLPPSRDVAPIVPGAADLVDALHAVGTPLAVASGSEREWLEHHLARFGMVDRFALLVGRDHPQVAAGKPAPDLYRVAMSGLGVDPTAVVAVEDTSRGIASARAAGVGAVVAVPSRLTVHHDLTTADVVLEALVEITPDLLAGLLP